MNKLIARFLLVVFALYASQPGAKSMREVFDDMQVNGNVSGPSVVQGQTMNIYSGGSLFMRTPKQTYQIVSMTPPSWGAGCGGIDLFSGGFSFIDKDQFVAMLRNIGSNAVGYGFKVAIQNLCPTCDNVMQALQATAQAMNRLNIDSCNAGKNLVNMSMPDQWSTDLTNRANGQGNKSGYFKDFTDGWYEVMNSSAKAVDTLNKASDADPSLKDGMPVNVNVVWASLKKVNGIDDEYRMLLMSMIGTVIFKGDSEPDVIPGLPMDIKTLMSGTSLEVYRCQGDMDKCLSIKLEPSKMKDGFQEMVEKKMYAISQSIAKREAHTDPDGVFAFVNATDIPVYKMLSVSSSLGNTSVADSMVGRYRDLIAAKYAEVYIRKAAVDLTAALTIYKSKSVGVTARASDDLLAKLPELEKKARDALLVAYSQSVSSFNIGQEVAFMERAMSSSLAPALRSSLVFGKGLR